MAKDKGRAQREVRKPKKAIEKKDPASKAAPGTSKTEILFKGGFKPKKG